MDQIVKIESVAQYARHFGMKAAHPLVTVFDLSKAQSLPAMSYNSALYAIYLVEGDCGEMRYGRSSYDYQEGTLLFTAPGQVIGIQPNVAPEEAKGWGLLFHPDLIKNTPLGSSIGEYGFFAYSVSESLHLSETEKEVVRSLLGQIDAELKQSVDRHSQGLISAMIDVLLKHCMRFYDRQFINRSNSNLGILERFERLLNEYFTLGNAEEKGLPTVAFFAERLSLTANYFGDLVKRETGCTAQEYIQSKVIDLAKTRIFDEGKSIAEIAYGLGFKYPQHFMRLFKQKTGIPPSQYRKSASA